MTRKLTNMLIISFVSVIAIILAVVSIIFYRIFFDFTSKEISETRLTLLNENAEKLSGFRNSVVEAGYYLAANQTIIDIFSEPVTDMYDAVTEQRQLKEQLNIMSSLKLDIEALNIYTDRYVGYPILQGSSVHSLSELEEEPWYDLLKQMDSGWIPSTDRDKGGPKLVSYIHRLVDFRGTKVGYVKVDVLEESFFANMSEDELINPLLEPLLLIDIGDRVIARTPAADSSGVMGEIAVRAADEPYFRLHETYRHLTDHHQVLKLDNKAYLLLISKPNYERWRMVQLIPVEPLYAEINRLVWYVLVVGMGVLLLSIPLIYWIGKKMIIVPVRKLIQGMRRVERGKFDFRIETLHIEEFNLLAQNFNLMTFELKQLIRQLDAAHRARRDAEMRMLQSQITPHFLYNTLDVIHWKAMDYRAEEISRMVNSLSRMFRIGLSGGRHFIPLREELEHAQCYMDIQRIRLNRDLRFEIRVPAYLKDYYVPKIILQPFIENSMKHGYDGKSAGQEHIRIDAAHEDERLRIIIEDNGIGLSEAWNAEQSAGIGIRNVQTRIRMYCGEAYGAELFNREEGGVRVVIRLPPLQSPEEVKDCLERNNEWLESMGITGS